MPRSNSLDRPNAVQSACDEPRSLIQLLVSSYGIAALIAVLSAFAGAGFWAAVLVFWLGGAAFVFLIASVPHGNKPSDARTDQTNIGVAPSWIALEAGQ
jgi:hypothetical protein